MAMRILLLGKNGQLGWELQRTLASLGELTALDYPDIDFSKPDDLRRLVHHSRPQVIVNAAAYTAVDRAESEIDLCRAINADAPAVLAAEAQRVDAAFIHFSTDYVFDGLKGSPYLEEDQANPLNVYGETKLAGECAAAEATQAYWIFRTSWVYSSRRDSFVSKVLEWSRKNSTLKIVSDQIGEPTWCRALAEVTTQALAQGRQNPLDWVKSSAGIYHLAGSGSASRLEWAREILLLDPQPATQVTQQVLPAATCEFPTPAVRPLNAAMNCDRFTQTFGLALPPWQTALRLMMQV